jgi:hypothetical protein
MMTKETNVMPPKESIAAIYGATGELDATDKFLLLFRPEDELARIAFDELFKEMVNDNIRAEMSMNDEIVALFPNGGEFVDRDTVLERALADVVRYAKNDCLGSPGNVGHIVEHAVSAIMQAARTGYAGDNDRKMLLLAASFLVTAVVKAEKDISASLCCMGEEAKMEKTMGSSYFHGVTGDE